MVEPDWDDDARDGALFRFWIRAGSEFPGETASAIAHATTPAEYRKALTDLAMRKRINLPPPAIDKRLLMTFSCIGPKPAAELGVDLTDEAKVRAYDALRDFLYPASAKGPTAS